MSTSKITPKKSNVRAIRTNNNRQVNSAMSTASTIAEAISMGTKFSQTDGKVNVHIHVGDIILLGFDEAIDAEEWGVRETNTEIVSGKAGQARSSSARDSEVKDQNRKTSRSIQVRKGELELYALENSAPLQRARVGTNKKSATPRTAKTRSRTMK